MAFGLAPFVGSVNGVDAPTNGLRRVEFREPQRTVYFLESTGATPRTLSSPADWIRASRDGRGTNVVLLGSRVVLQLKPGVDAQSLLRGRALTISRTVRSDLFILQATNSLSAINEAASLAQRPEVVASYPVMRRAMKLQGRYAPSPNDPYFPKQWHLENRDTNGVPLGADLNARSAWSTTRGEGVLVAVADDGIELTHPDLAAPVEGQPHFNFDTSIPDGSPEVATADHATAVAGLIAAQADNLLGVSGVAPKAAMASWVIFGAFGQGQEQLVSNEALMEMFQYASHQVAVQNHSWGNASYTLQGIDALSEFGISNAIALGRNGLGEILVRAAGNDRASGMNADEDGFASDPRAIAVAATRFDGRVCSYSNPGACLLISAPSGDPNGDGTEDPAAPNIVTTDRQGALGYQTNGPGDSADYCSGNNGFNGTSASTPQISGLAALILAANPNLGYRDVQQILLQSARHFDFLDPDIRTNAAGLIFSHNQGFGVPDAGLAVSLAKRWSNRPPMQEIRLDAGASIDIPTNALHLICTGASLNPSLASIACLPAMGAQADAPTAIRPLVYVGQANADLTQDLHGKAALIQRGISLFADKIDRAAQAGADFAVVFDNTSEANLLIMAGTEFTSIPAVFISQADGEVLVAYLEANSDLQGRIALDTATVSFTVTNSLVCEHVGLLLSTTAPYRSDLRVTLVSPSGTRSVLQTLNADASPGPLDWTYWSVLHFYEPSAGVWRLEASNEQGSDPSSITAAQLRVQGVPITDTDQDGLDDAWERRWFGSLAYGPRDNPSGDGCNNARKQCLSGNPAEFTALLPPDASLWNDHLARISFPTANGGLYQILSSPSLSQPFAVLTNLIGRFPEIEFMVPVAGSPKRFFRAQRIASAAQISTSIRTGSSIRSFTRLRKVTASRPSTIR